MFKQGCSTPQNPCVPEQRNRQDVFCCTSNLCNNVSAPSTPSPPPCETERSTTSQPSERTEEPSITTGVPHESGERQTENIAEDGSAERHFITTGVSAHGSGEGERGTGNTADNSSAETSIATKVLQKSQLGREGTGGPSEPGLHSSSNTGGTKASSAITTSTTTAAITTTGVQPSPSCLQQLTPVSQKPVMVSTITVTATVEGQSVGIILLL